MSIDWSKAPKGATHFDPVDQNWLMQFLNVSFGWLSSEGWTTKGWQYPNDLSTMTRLVARPAWPSQGLPPIGTVCEVQDPNEPSAWYVCRIIAHDSEIAVFKFESEYPWMYDGQCSGCFRPIRTPEQIAAEEREAGIQSILDDYTYTEGPCTHKLTTGQATRIYDAGYRKEVKS